LLLDDLIILGATVDRQADGLLLTIHNGFAGGLFGTDRYQCDLSRWGFGAVFIDEREVDFFDDLQDGLGLEGRAVQPLLDFGEELGVEGLGIQAFEDLAILIANTHGLLLSGTQFCTHYKR